MHHTSEDIALEEKHIRQAQRNPKHFEWLYNKYFEPIYAYLFRRTGDADLAGDLCSQTFLKALAKLSTYKPCGLPFGAWLFRIASNELNLYYRETKKSTLYSLEAMPLSDMIDSSSSGLEKKEEQEQLKISLSRLPPADLEVITLRFYEELSFKEIAYILATSESAAKMRLYRSLEKLRLYFEEFL
ncbi:MAG: sigma-70 family RNA polymerase sigma factor [Bernardetiaceae bacterium]|nr:sigma-70 family RNA polymerase sigma factor [Bernardetiaceae bacterium]